MSKIKVVPYNQNWPVLFAEESDSIRKCLKSNFIAIHHIGSTSVEGLCAKPQIDIILIAKDIILAASQLEELSYVSRGEMNIPFHQFCKKNLVEHGYNIHIYEEGDAQIELNLIFRDTLRKYQYLREEYAKLKMNLVKQKKLHSKQSSGFSGYNLEKNNFILKVRKKAGFNRFYMTYCIHYNEWKNYHRIVKQSLPKPEDLSYQYNHEVLCEDNKSYFVFYKAVDVIGAASVDSESAIYNIAVDKGYEKYRTKMQNLLETWMHQHK